MIGQDRLMLAFETQLGVGDGDEDELLLRTTGIDEEALTSTAIEFALASGSDPDPRKAEAGAFIAGYLLACLLVLRD